jgi:hypothetical protein
MFSLPDQLWSVDLLEFGGEHLLLVFAVIVSADGFS